MSVTDIATWLNALVGMARENTNKELYQEFAELGILTILSYI
jgi:hypothetical protein